MVMFRADQGRVVHVANDTKSTPRSAVSLCGKAFADFKRTGGTTTCARCARFDNPFHTSVVLPDPSAWPAVMSLSVLGSGLHAARAAMLKRDLITQDGRVTPRGTILARDLVAPTPWVDAIGIIHARRPRAARVRSACGAVLADIHGMTYDRLNKMHALYESVDVTCMACVAIGASQS